MTPPTTDASTERESPWPFTIEAKVIAVPAPLARLGIGLLGGVILTIIGATWLVLNGLEHIATVIAQKGV